MLAFAVFGQAELFPDKEPTVASDLDTIPLPESHPELVLARRAMASEGLCETTGPGQKSLSKDADADWRKAVPVPGAAPVESMNLVRLVSESCP